MPSSKCEHTTMLVTPSGDGRGFYGRCLVCGQVGPEGATSEDAARALRASASVARGRDKQDEGKDPEDTRSGRTEHASFTYPDRYDCHRLTEIGLR